MIKLATVLAVALTSIVSVSAQPAFAQSKPAPKANTWEGTWSGVSSAGGRTTVKIAGDKVTFWTNNGFPRPKATGSVRGNMVALDDNNGWKGTMTLQSEGKARISAAGIGNNGQPAKNTAILVKE